MYLTSLSPTSIILSGKFLGQRSLAGCSPWGHKEWYTTEHVHTRIHTHGWTHRLSPNPLKGKLRMTMVLSSRESQRIDQNFDTLTHWKWRCQRLSHVQLFVTPWTVANGTRVSCIGRRILYHWAICKVFEGYSFGIFHSSTTVPIPSWC